MNARTTLPRHRPTRASLVTGVALLPCALLGTTAANAQSTLHGRVLDSETGRPLAGVTVAVQRGQPTIITDSLGRFLAPGLSEGQHRVDVRLLGYSPGSFLVEMPASGDLHKVFPLDFTGERLPEVLVQERARELMPRYMEFETRRERGVGAFFRWDELKNRNYNSVGDALRTVRGIRMHCDQERFECYAVMARTPRCQPTWFVDGMEARSFHENTPIRDIYGIEIYRGPGEIPGEFAGSNAACGVIVVWTKSKPFR